MLDIQSVVECLLIWVDVVILVFGGGSWQCLGFDGVWVFLLWVCGVEVEFLWLSNCGFEIGGWSELFCDKFFGVLVKLVVMGLVGEMLCQGEFVVICDGIEGSLVYVFFVVICEWIEVQGLVEVWLDLLLNRCCEQIEVVLVCLCGFRLMVNYLCSQLGIDGVWVGFLCEFIFVVIYVELVFLVVVIKCLLLMLLCLCLLDEVISSVGGVCFEVFDCNLMFVGLFGVFCVGEMFDWEVFIGGYLLIVCFVSGCVVGFGVLVWLCGRGQRLVCQCFVICWMVVFLVCLLCLC